MAVKPSRVPYLEIAAAIRDQIRSGELAPGDQVKTVRALAAEYSVALGTVGAALEILRSEGLIDTVKGRGSVVIAMPAPAGSDAALGELRAWVEDQLAGLRYDVERLQVQMMAVYDRQGIPYPHERDRDPGGG
jgi:DNA-binding GntR family transcriptional regulator